NPAARSAPTPVPHTSRARPDSATETGSASACAATSFASMRPRCRDSPVPAPSSSGRAVQAALDMPRAAYLRQCRKEHVVGSIVEPEEKVHEAAMARIRGQSIPIQIRRPEPVADIESQHERRTNRHPQSETTRAEHTAIRGRRRPGPAVIEKQRALHAREPGRAERKPNREEVENRKPVLHVDEPGARAGDVAVLRIAAQCPGAPDADAPRSLAARGVAQDAQRERA